MSHFFRNLIISLLSMIRIITFFFVFKVYNIALDDEFSLSNILLRIRDGLGVTEVTKQTLRPGACSGICPGEGLNFFFLSKGGLVAPSHKNYRFN